MKKIILLLSLSFILSVSLFSQIIEYDIQVKYNTSATSVTADIAITVTSGKPDYTYYITTNDPLKGQVIAKSEKTKKDHYTFKGIQPGTYFVKIEDSTGMFAGKSIIIKVN
jgi:hypothetical protein